MTNTPKTVHKALRLLRAVTALQGSSLSELARATEVPVATAHRLLRALEEEGLVQQADDQTFRLGSYCVVLGSSYLANVDLRSEARPLLERLVAETGETAHLGILTGLEIVYVDKVETTHPVRMYSRVGALSPLHSTGMGKALLAASGDDLVGRVIAAGLKRRTANTITNPDRLRAELERVRDRGFAIDDVENEEGIRCAGAAVIGADGSPLAALSVAGPASRMPEERLFEVGQQVAATARALSERFGYDIGGA